MFFFFNDTATTEIYTLSLHDALPISDPQEAEVAIHVPLLVVHAGAQQGAGALLGAPLAPGVVALAGDLRAEIGRHTSELQSRQYLVCRLLLEKKKTQTMNMTLSMHTL